MASWAGARTAESALHASRSLAAKAVHIDVRPSPRDLHERRGILRVLKQFGDVIMFQPLKDDPETPSQHGMLAMYEDETSAQKLISEAPLEFEIEPIPKPQRNSSLETLDLLQPDYHGDSTDDLTPSIRRSELFTLTAGTSRTDHLGRLQRQKYYWGFEPSRKEFAHEDLVGNVPLEAYSDMQLHPKPVPQRIAAKKLEDLANTKSLKELWDEGQRERERMFPGRAPIEESSTDVH